MRTTLSIDDDVHAAAKAMAEHSRRSLGSVISELARNSLQRPQFQRERNGIPLLRPRPGSAPVTIDLVNRLRDQLP